MNDLPKVSNQLEFLFLKRLSAGLKNGSIDLQTAKKLTSTFLQIEPFSSIEDAIQKMQAFVVQFPDFSQLKEYVEAYFSEQYKDVRIEQMRTHLKQGDIDQALEVAKN